MSASGMIDPGKAAELLDARDPLLFSERLLDLAHSNSGIEEIFAYRVTDGGMPKLLASVSNLADSTERTSTYAKRFHHSDPVLSTGQAAREGSGFSLRIAADQIELGAYRRLCFDRPRFREKLSYGWRGANSTLILSFYQQREQREEEIANLTALAQLGMVGLNRIDEAPATGLPLVEEIDRRLARTYRILTAREREVLARTLAGSTAREIGEELRLGHGTVLTYRQRAYQKLGASKASDVLSAIMG